MEEKVTLYDIMRQEDVEKLKSCELLYKVNWKNGYGEAPIHVAISKLKSNQAEIVNVLLSAGADVNSVGPYDRTPLHYVVKSSMLSQIDLFVKIARILISWGADLGVRDSSRWTPTCLAAIHGNLELVKLFLENEVDPEVENENLLLVKSVIIGKNIQVLRSVISWGLDVNRRDAEQNTAVHLACESYWRNDPKMVKCFWENGADMNALNVESQTPLMLFLDNVCGGYFRNAGVQKTLRFLLWHSDMGIASPLMDSVLWTQNCLTLITEHIAKIEALDGNVHLVRPNAILKTDDDIQYFVKCKKELIKARQTTFYTAKGNLLDLLTNNKMKFIMLSNNEEIRSMLVRNNLITEFPIYSQTMYDNMRRGLTTRMAWNETAVRFNLISPVTLTQELLYKIFSKLRKRDLRAFVEATNPQD